MLKAKGRGRSWPLSRGRNKVEVIAATHGQAGSGRRETVIIRGVHENLKVNPATTTKSSLCFAAGCLLTEITLPVRMFISKSLMQSQDIVCCNNGSPAYFLLPLQKNSLQPFI